MSDTICIEIPREIVKSTHMSPTELRLELVLSLFQQKKISFGKASEMAQVPLWEFQQILASRGISLHYDIEDYEKDIETLRELGRL